VLGALPYGQWNSSRAVDERPNLSGVGHREAVPFRRWASMDGLKVEVGNAQQY
jgi:hypothetical protein